MPQMLLFPDPRPLVERLGADFFRQAPECPGVYLMRGAADQVLYVGKAKNLRKRLASYRVANPDRLRRRHLRLLRAVERIEFEQCPDEPTALAREAELLRTLRPAFNRAGTWPGPPRFLSWRLTGTGLELGVVPEKQADACCYGPMGAGAGVLRAALARLGWCAMHAPRGYAALPAGWLGGRFGEPVTVPRDEANLPELQDLEARLARLFAGEFSEFIAWVRERTSSRRHPFEEAIRETDLETIANFGERRLERDTAIGD